MWTTHSLCVYELQLLLAIFNDLSSTEDVGVLFLGRLLVHLYDSQLTFITCRLQQ